VKTVYDKVTENFDLNVPFKDYQRLVCEEFEKNGQAPSIRKLTKESGVDTKELYALFPKGPAKKAAKYPV